VSCTCTDVEDRNSKAPATSFMSPGLSSNQYPAQQWRKRRPANKFNNCLTVPPLDLRLSLICLAGDSGETGEGKLRRYSQPALGSMPIHSCQLPCPTLDSLIPAALPKTQQQTTHPTFITLPLKAKGSNPVATNEPRRHRRQRLFVLAPSTVVIILDPASPAAPGSLLLLATLSGLSARLWHSISSCLALRSASSKPPRPRIP